MQCSTQLVLQSVTACCTRVLSHTVRSYSSCTAYYLIGLHVSVTLCIQLTLCATHHALVHIPDSKTKATAMSLATALSQDDGSQIQGVKGSWGTKVSALTGTLLSLPPGSKALVFSEWDQMLDIVQEVMLLLH
jgi:hypothetical protein